MVLPPGPPLALVFTCPVDSLVSTLGLPPEPLELLELLEFAVLEAEELLVEVEVLGPELLPPELLLGLFPLPCDS